MRHIVERDFIRRLPPFVVYRSYRTTCAQLSQEPQYWKGAIRRKEGTRSSLTKLLVANTNDRPQNLANANSAVIHGRTVADHDKDRELVA